MSINLLTDPVISIDAGSPLSLPEMFAAMARDEVRAFPALRPHQRPAWHMFTVQLATLATWTSKHFEISRDATIWRSLFRTLTQDWPDDAPWNLVVENTAIPAFLQPPDPGGLKWTDVPTPDSLDILITARNHEIKQSVARQSSAEDWIFALVSQQTSAGYDGKGNYRIARMNGGSSSRPMLGLAPARGQDHRVNPSQWWLRDVQQLLLRRRSGGGAVDRMGGIALLWCVDWPEGDQLDLGKLDPLCIEVSRRVRLRETDGRLTAIRANSRGPRVDAKAYKGNVGDPWAPIHVSEGKSLTLGTGDFDYKRLRDLMFSGDWKVPVLAELGRDEVADDRLLIAEALSRGNSKTEGFRSRIVPVPHTALRFFGSPEKIAEVSKEIMSDIAEFDAALRIGIAILAAGGESASKAHYARSHAARNRFDRVADRLFFPELWKRLAVLESDSPEAEDNALREFREELFDASSKELEEAIPAVPCAAIARPKAEARCRRAFHARVRKLVPRRDANASTQVDSHAEIPA